ncbi:DNA-processing protein DprA [Aquabacterium parvum]|uniref:DNA-processing protein DprA n=1 Tax=Aquabacterium parvum TaxID=70584 RepID=UPI000718CAA0|nr:DNA-processing protein DprA [Aquabacterium parvum]MBU0915953.1 DNA-processing protein DprA [Gammaproteobacteria bacterium]
MSFSPDELGAWLRLLLVPGLGPASARRLLAAFGSPQAVFAASPDAVRAVLPRFAPAALQADSGWQAELERTWMWLQGGQEGIDRAVLTLADKAYPTPLLDAVDPPLVLFAEGDLSRWQRPAVAIVGSRNPTQQGVENAHAFARALSEAGVVVVSGLARGVDAAAHDGALQPLEASEPTPGVQGAGGTIAVLGTGFNEVYPKGHKPLARRVARNGLVLSEFPLNTPPLAANFPRRNRIVAALSRGTLVVEAAVQSGSLITARLANEMGREVLAIPGSIHSPQAKGCHALIKQGAKLVETAQDVLEELRLGAPSPIGPEPATSHIEASGDGADAEDPVLRAMGHDPVGQDALSARTGLGPAELGARLLELELMGQVARLPGALFQRLARA